MRGSDREELRGTERYRESERERERVRDERGKEDAHASAADRGPNLHSITPCPRREFPYGLSTNTQLRQRTCCVSERKRARDGTRGLKVHRTVHPGDGEPSFGGESERCRRGDLRNRIRFELQVVFFEFETSWVFYCYEFL